MSNPIKRREEKCPPSCQLALSSELLAWARSYFHSTVCRKDSATEILTFYKYFNQSRPRFIDIFRMSQCSKCNGMKSKTWKFVRLLRKIQTHQQTKWLILMFYYQFNQVVVVKTEEIQNIQQNTVKSANPFFTLLDLILKITQKVGKSRGFLFCRSFLVLK